MFYATKKDLFKDVSMKELKKCMNKISLYTEIKNTNSDENLKNILNDVSLLKLKINALRKDQHTFVHSNEIQHVLNSIIRNRILL